MAMSEFSRLDQLTQRTHRIRNTVHTWLLAAGSLMILAASAWAFAGPAGVVYAIVFGGASLWVAGRVSPRMVLAMYKARPVSRANFPEGAALIEELGRRARLPAMPRPYVVPSNMMNAFAVGRPGDSAIAITDALARRLTLRELAGVLAHEVSHVAHDDLKVMAFADMVSRFTSFMATVGVFTLLFNLVGAIGGYAVPVPWIAVLILVTAPTLGGLLQLALSRTREFDADLGAAMLTGDPDGLASALHKLERAQGRHWESLVLPGGRSPAPSILRTHPPTEERVARLMALKKAGGVAVPSPDRGRPILIPQPSPLPRIRRAAAAPDRHPASVMRAMPDLADSIEHDEDVACAGGLCDPEPGPRIRIRRGGVWW